MFTMFIYSQCLQNIMADWVSTWSDNPIGFLWAIFCENKAHLKKTLGSVVKVRLPISRGFCAIMPHHLLLSVHSQRHTEQEIRGRQTSRNDTCKQQVELRLFRYLGAASRLRDWKTTVGECWEAEMRQVNQF